MKSELFSRREMVKTASLAAGILLAGGYPSRAEEKKSGAALHLSCNQYTLQVYYQREKRDFMQSLDAGFKDVASCNFNGFEPSISDPKQIDQLMPLLKKNGLEMRSIYVGSTLHNKEEVEKNLNLIVAIAEKAQSVGTKIIVTNPSPLGWGGGAQDKNDDQLKVQAEALNKLGQKLTSKGLVLAYHNHDMELRNAAREFHHMLLGTDPQYMTFCLDSHWVYRGSGNSSVALFDVLKLYGKRVSELHIRQSVKQVWSEFFGEGDIDYPQLVKDLLALGVKPHLVLEQAVETGTPQTMDTVTALRKSNENVRRIFADFAG